MTNDNTEKAPLRLGREAYWFAPEETGRVAIELRRAYERVGILRSKGAAA